LGRQDFAMEASSVRGILPARELTAPRKVEDFERFARPSRWTCGYAAIQGKDFPVLNLRGKLGLLAGPPGRMPCIVVVELEGLHGPQLTGFIADNVSEIVQARERDFSGGKLRNGGRPRRVLSPQLLL
jgi:chemotaxis signal transduction protein